MLSEYTKLQKHMYSEVYKILKYIKYSYFVLGYKHTLKSYKIWNLLNFVNQYNHNKNKFKKGKQEKKSYKNMRGNDKHQKQEQWFF